MLFLFDLRVLAFADFFRDTRAAARSPVALSFDAAAFGVIFFSAIQVLLFQQGAVCDPIRLEQHVASVTVRRWSPSPVPRVVRHRR
jgi:hypothetical protein